MKEDEGTPRQRRYELGKVVSEILPLSPAPLLILQADSKTAIVNPRANLDPIHLGASKLELCTEKGILCEPQGSESLSQCQLCLPPHPFLPSPIPTASYVYDTVPLSPSFSSLFVLCLPPSLASLFPSSLFFIPISHFQSLFFILSSTFYYLISARY